MKTRSSSIEPLESRIAPAVIFVTTTSDTAITGKTTLRQALAQADNDLTNHLGVVNTIKFNLPQAAANKENIIALSAVLTSKGDVNIIGPGAGKLIITGGDTSGVFSFTNGATDSPVSISGLTVLGGSAANGAGIDSTESITLSNVVISSSTASSGAGGLQVNAAATSVKVSITNSQITGNTGTDGGGIGLYLVKSFSLTNTVITGNIDRSAGGGGFYAGLASTNTGGTITNCRVTANTAQHDSGIEVFDPINTKTSQVHITNSVVSGNASTTTSGGISIVGGVDTITNTLVRGNSATYTGGGIYARLSTGSLTISHSVITGNTTTATNASGQGGGGLYIVGPGTTTLPAVQITGSSITDNHSALDGGGLFATDGLALTIASTIVGGNNAAHNGGGIATEGTGTAKVNLAVIGGTFSNNVGSEGGAIEATGSTGSTGDGTLTLTSAHITGNFGAEGGGVAANTNGAITLKNNTITNNVGSNYGGGLDLNVSKTVLITGGIVSGNESHRGGGMWLYQATGKVDNVTITNNIATEDGGGINSANSSFTLHGDIFSGNTAISGPDTSGGITFV